MAFSHPAPDVAHVRELVHRLSAKPLEGTTMSTHVLGSAAWLETLNLQAAVQTNTDMENLVEAVQEVRSLNLASSSIGDEGLIVLMRAFKEGGGRGSILRELDLTSNGITKRGFEELTRARETKCLSSLENLIMSQNNLGVEGVNMLSSVLRTGHLSSLRGLDLSYCNMGIVGMMSLADALQSGNFSAWQLQSLDLSGNGIEELGALSLAKAMGLGKIPQLRFLNLSTNKLGEQGTHALSNAFQSGEFLGLTHLLLSRCHLSNTVGPIANALKGLPNLQVLDVSGNHMGDHDSVALATALRGLPRLHHLNLSQCGIRARQANFITEAIKAGRVLGLRYLDLSCNPLDCNYNSLSSSSSTMIHNSNDRGSAALVHLMRGGYLSALEHLDLSQCSITDIGLMELAPLMTAGKLPRLQHFLFNDNEIRSKLAIKALVSALESRYLGHLRELELGQNSVGEDITMALASALTFSKLAQGPLVEKLKSKLVPEKSHKSFGASETRYAACDYVKNILRNKSFRALEAIKVADSGGRLPPGEKLYNKYLDRQYSNHLTPLVHEEIAGRPEVSKFFFNLLFVCAWLMSVLVWKRF